MINLQEIERRLNSDESARREFLKDPVSYLDRQGIALSEENQRRLRERAAKLQSSEPSIAGGLSAAIKAGEIRLYIRDELL